ncbi:hypothetical protein Pmani_002043 [Petrolisthes manimaculis]|uniref:Major facilitator superfamily (MFS) profile domain-containing protein n=1 Tax=Petrolisthes manimaculis TaxID=1843537 RepID=A0AAE1QLK0_9EUCA|nr:hypothetical protein Pmani_002043 [Petrolisthes manimaculis]
MSNIPSVSNGDDDTLLSCSSRVYNTSQYESSVVTEWDLTCERRALYSTTSSIQQVGSLIGSLFYGYLLEAIGRRKAVLFSSVSSILASLLTIVSPNVETFLFFRMMHQAFDFGYYMGPVILCDVSNFLTTSRVRDFLGTDGTKYQTDGTKVKGL